jgi:hypothetical protein
MVTTQLNPGNINPQHYASPHATLTVNSFKVEGADGIDLALRFGSQNCQLMEAAIYFGSNLWKRRRKFGGSRRRVIISLSRSADSRFASNYNGEKLEQ